MSSTTTNIEKENLEAHVELCAARYHNLDTKLEALDTRIGKIEVLVLEVKNALSSASQSQNNQLIKIGTTLVGVLITAVIGLITHLILK